MKRELDRGIFRTTVDIDDGLMKRAMRATGAKTKSATVQLALEALVRFGDQERVIRESHGKFHWEGDLKAMRRDRFPKRRK